MTPRELNQRIKAGLVYWLCWKDGSRLRVYKAVSRYNAVYVMTMATGWQRADQVECGGETFTLAAESKPEKPNSIFRKRGD